MSSERGRLSLQFIGAVVIRSVDDIILISLFVGFERV